MVGIALFMFTAIVATVVHTNVGREPVRALNLRRTLMGQR